jgi:HEAT repeat protein
MRNRAAILNLSFVLIAATAFPAGADEPIAEEIIPSRREGAETLINMKPITADRAEELQEAAAGARRVRRRGSDRYRYYYVETSRGKTAITAAPTFEEIFGDGMRTAELHELLKVRAQDGLSGEGTMAGHRRELCCAVLYVLSEADDPASIPVIQPLLKDPDEVIAGWAVIALFELGNANEELQRLAEPIEFPAAPVATAEKSPSVRAPAWARVEGRTPPKPAATPPPTSDLLAEAFATGRGKVVDIEPPNASPAQQMRPIVERAEELQAAAVAYNRGVRRGGARTYYVATNQGMKAISAGYGLDMVFGEEISLADLNALLVARADANKIGEGPMAGQRRELTCLTLAAVAKTGDPASLRFVEPLLKDPEEAIAGWAVIALIDLAYADNETRRLAEEIELPASAVAAAQRGSSFSLPHWAKVESPAASDAETSSGQQVASASSGSLVERAEELQAAAVAYNRGARRGGVKSYEIATSQGRKTISAGYGLNSVFGDSLSAADLHALLAARADANKIGEGPMAGKRRELTCLALAALKQASDPQSIPFIQPLLDDPDDFINGWAAIALLDMGRADDKLLPFIARIEFPEAAVKRALQPHETMESLPEWVRIRKP